MSGAKRARLQIAIRHLERARKALVAAVGEPPVVSQADHPVDALDVAIHLADATLLDWRKKSG